MHLDFREMRAKGLLGTEPYTVTPFIGLPEAALSIRRFATLSLKKVNTGHTETCSLKQDTLGRMRPWQSNQQSNRQRCGCWLRAHDLKLESTVSLDGDNLRTRTSSVHKAKENQGADLSV